MRTRAAALVGRDQELTRLAESLHATHDGYGGAVFLVGEPGIGKTRLASAAVGIALDLGMVTARGHGSTIGPMVPFRPLTEALMSLARRGQLPELADAGWSGQVLGLLVPDLSTGAPMPVRHSAVVIAEALLRILADIGRRHGGCLLILEDLHDVDAETLAIVEYLLDNVHDQPIQLLATLRHEPSPALDLASAARQRDPVTVLELQRLDRDSVGALAASWLTAQQDPPKDTLTSVAIDRIFADTEGVPFIVEELLYELTRTGELVRDDDGGWQLHEAPSTRIPATVVRSINLRTDRLGPEAGSVLRIAAVMGRRFALSVIGRAAGINERFLLTTMHAGVAAQLVRPDEPAPDWYAFRHPLTAEAIRTGLPSTERAVLSTQVADAIEAMYPDLPGDWCARVAGLRGSAGDSHRAGQLYAEAGRRALAGGAVQSAVAMLELADGLLAVRSDSTERADVLESLLYALKESGQFDRTFELEARLTELADAGLGTARRAVLTAQFADVAQLAGRWEDAARQLRAARALIDEDATVADRARIDAIAARLQLSQAHPDRLRIGLTLAERAASAAEQAALPDVGCDALQMLGAFTAETDIDKSNAYIERARSIADLNHLPVQRLFSEAILATNECRVDGSLEALWRAYHEALRIGAMPIAFDVHAVLAMQTIRRGDLDTATAIIKEDLEVATRLQFGRARTYLLVSKAVLFAHQAARAAMEEVLAELDRDEGHALYARPVSYGLARAYCSLLEENRERAEEDLRRALAYDAENPTYIEFGRKGLPVLLRVLAHRDDWAEVREVATKPSGGRTRWNAQSIHLARAVLLGRDGRVSEANDAVAEAREAAAIYPLTRHLGLRLVAQEAYEHGWGDPIGWLREAEEFFHQHEIPAVAGACRAMLRQMGASVRQRRAGADQVPDVLRQAGVTAREYDVCRLIADRIGNKAIASQLHISPRTVEKHVASLLAKTNQPDRESLTTYARAVLVD
jgi:DNA-binding CsgD family transcriptional regulator/tetratricopeptide (TPR) repeat protein